MSLRPEGTTYARTRAIALRHYVILFALLTAILVVGLTALSAR